MRLDVVVAGAVDGHPLLVAAPGVEQPLRALARDDRVVRGDDHPQRRADPRRQGRGVDDVKTLHRIEQGVLVDEVERAGFRLEAATSILGNPQDTRDWNASPTAAGERRGTSDRFVLRFVKPD